MSLTENPNAVGPEQTFSESLSSGILSIQRCDSCKSYIFFPRIFCHHCGSDNLFWARISGKATIYSCTKVNRSEDKGGPYHLLLVDLLEGPRMIARFLNEPSISVEIGMEVKLSAGKLDGNAVVLASLVMEPKS